MSWYLQALKKYAVFSGRARRKEYWYFCLFNSIIFSIFYILSFIQGLAGSASEIGMVLSVIYDLAVFLPGIGVSIRRLHDTGHSAWWNLIILVPVIGLIVFAIFMVRDSQEGTNQYGSSPLKEKAKPQSNEETAMGPSGHINWQIFRNHFQTLGLMHKGFPKTYIADQIVMLIGAYEDMMWLREKNPRLLPTVQTITNAYQFLSNLLEQQIEMGVTPDIDLETLQEASKRTIYCRGCGRRLIPHLEITRYSSETSRPVYCMHYKCHNNRIFSTKRHDSEQISLE